MIIAIDGPSGAGKSSVSKGVAERLGFACLDTGAMYRSVAWFALQEGVALDDERRLAHIAKTKPISFVNELGSAVPKQVFIDGIEVTDVIRSAEIDRAVSPVSAIPEVRRWLTRQQQRIGEEGNYVVEGRDIGTVVFPRAELKVFLTASDEARAARRVLQNKGRGVGSTDYEEVLADLRQRDEKDSLRAAAPLKPAEDAIVIDSTKMTEQQVIDKICVLVKERMR